MAASTRAMCVARPCSARAWTHDFDGEGVGRPSESEASLPEDVKSERGVAEAAARKGGVGSPGGGWSGGWAPWAAFEGPPSCSGY